MQENLMRVNYFISTLFTINAVALLFGCSSRSVPDIDEVTSILKTQTPVPNVISDSTNDKVNLKTTFSGHSRRVLDVAFSAQGDYLVSSSQDMNMKVWDVKSGGEVQSFRMMSVDMADIDISMGNNLLATGEAIWDLESLQELHVLERGSPLPGFVAFSPDGALLALGLFEQQIRLWDVANGEPVFTFDRQEENRTKRMAFSPDGTLLAVGVIDGTVRLVDIASGNILKTLAYRGETDIHDLAFSPDGVHLATGGRVPAAVLWEVASGEVVRTFQLTDNLISMDFSPDGKILATAGGANYEVRLWDVVSGNLLDSQPHNNQVSSVSYSPDGRLLAVGCFDSNIYLWEISANP
jgi:WD40 repeat protein